MGFGIGTTFMISNSSSSFSISGLVGALAFEDGRGLGPGFCDLKGGGVLVDEAQSHGGLLWIGPPQRLLHPVQPF
jgi:hypothetical protein